MQFALHYKKAKKNNQLPPKPFQLFLKEGVGVEKRFVVTAVTEHLLRVLKYLNQNLDQQSVLLTAFTGKADYITFGISLPCQVRVKILC